MSFSVYIEYLFSLSWFYGQKTVHEILQAGSFLLMLKYQWILFIAK